MVELVEIELYIKGQSEPIIFLSEGNIKLYSKNIYEQIQNGSDIVYFGYCGIARELISYFLIKPIM